jgi:peroxidase
LQNPQIDGGLAAELTSACPHQGANPSTTLNLDTSTPDLFDNAYYSNLLNGGGVLESDQVLFSDQSTRPSAIFNSVAAGPWSVAFSAAMIKMSELDLKTGADGEIRRNCRLVN